MRTLKQVRQDFLVEMARQQGVQAACDAALLNAWVDTEASARVMVKRALWEAWEPLGAWSIRLQNVPRKGTLREVVTC